MKCRGPSSRWLRMLARWALIAGSGWRGMPARSTRLIWLRCLPRQRPRLSRESLSRGYRVGFFLKDKISDGESQKIFFGTVKEIKSRPSLLGAALIMALAER